MDCKRVKKIISTDYLDGELDKEHQKIIEGHLKTCGECRFFEASLRKYAVSPFKEIKEEEPPARVWEKIRHGIEYGSAGTTWEIPMYIREFLRPLFSIPRPVAVTIAIAIFAAIATGTAISIGSENEINNYFQEQREFLSSLNSGGNSQQVSVGPDLGTAIENIFL